MKPENRTQARDQRLLAEAKQWVRPDQGPLEDPVTGWVRDAEAGPDPLDRGGAESKPASMKRRYS